MAHRYSHLYDLWSRPDMAPFIFTKKKLTGDTINDGDMWRDFTHIDDIVEGIADVVPVRDSARKVESGTAYSTSAPYSFYNLGNGSPINLMCFVKVIEDELGIETKKIFREM